MSRGLLRGAALAATLFLGGCATANLNTARNLPFAHESHAQLAAAWTLPGKDAIALSFSGGGLRAAAFAHGVLEALESVRTPGGDALDDVAYVGSVSAGSLTAAHYALNGRKGLTRFRDEVLLHDFEADIRVSPWLPWNLGRILGGGLNASEDFGQVLDARVFRGATFADLYERRGPELRINATDLYHRVPFAFIPQAFALICSDLASLGVADAVAASMAVPVVFAPIVLRAYPESCEQSLPPGLAWTRFDPDAPMVAKAAEQAIRAYRDGRTRYIKLGDGGISDNLGLSTLMLSRIARGTPYAPMTEGDAARIRRLLFVVVDASQGPNGHWANQESGPGGLELAIHAAEAAVDSAARLAAESFAPALESWRDAIVHHRCALPLERAEQFGADSTWRCDDVEFTLAIVSIDRLDEPLRGLVEAIPTRLSLTQEQVDLAIEAGRRAMLGSPRFHRYLRERGVVTRVAGD